MSFNTSHEILNRSAVPLGDGSYRLNVGGSLTIGGTRVLLKDSQDLSVAPFEYTTSFVTDAYFRGLTLTCTNGAGVKVPIYEDIQIIIDSGDDNFDNVLFAEDFINENGDPCSDFSFFPDSSIVLYCGSGLQLKVLVTNHNLNGIINMALYMEVI